jgi:hypothetical protein
MKKIALLLMLVSALLLVTAACQPDRTPPPDAPAEPVVQPTHPTGGDSSAGEQVDESSGEVSEAPDANPEPTVVPVDDEGLATDIPIPEDAYKIQIMRKGSSTTFQVDSTIEEVVSWYQEELPKGGWEFAGPPDSAVGAIATMLRENSGGDRLTINMQSNELAGFVSITVVVIRGGQ